LRYPGQVSKRKKLPLNGIVKGLPASDLWGSNSFLVQVLQAIGSFLQLPDLYRGAFLFGKG